ncbi:MAG: hypothetical protein P4L54_01270 [Acidocella sp.]|nr:hypothetical protein [Acidocella sp.]
MKTLGMTAALLMWGLLAIAPAFAFIDDPPPAAPAPMLASGIPAFIAVGGGAALVRLLRKRRD